MAEGFPLWLILFDYLAGIVMWILILRAAMGICLPAESRFFFLRLLVRTTNPLERLFRPVTPSFLVQSLAPLYVAWFIFMIRFYLMPWLLGYSLAGFLSLPLEGDVVQGLSSLVGRFTL